MIIVYDYLLCKSNRVHNCFYEQPIFKERACSRPKNLRNFCMTEMAYVVYMNIVKILYFQFADICIVKGKLINAYYLQNCKETKLLTVMLS